MVQLNKLFSFEYGNKFDLNKMKRVDEGDEEAMSETVNFIGRTGKNLGVTAHVKQKEGVSPYPKGLVTVALGGSILSSFIQPKPFYTAQNIMVLSPKKKMTFQDKAYYCACIEKNIFKYSAFGREANRTLKLLDVPPKPPIWVNKINMTKHLQERIKTEASRLIQESQ